MGVQCNYDSLRVPRIAPLRPSFSDHDVDYDAILAAFEGILITKNLLNDYLFEQGVSKRYWKRIRFYLWHTGLWPAHNGRILNSRKYFLRAPSRKGVKLGKNILSEIQGYDL